jgi:hypothetical protein
VHTFNTREVAHKQALHVCFGAMSLIALFAQCFLLCCARRCDENEKATLIFFQNYSVISVKRPQSTLNLIFEI